MVSDNETYANRASVPTNDVTSRHSPSHHQQADDLRNMTFSGSNYIPRINHDKVVASANSQPASSRNMRSTVVNQAARLNLNRIVLYKRGHFIESAKSFFIVEISTTAEGSLYIAAFDIQSNTSLLMQ